MQKHKSSCIILSGGLSTRMSSHKALLMFSHAENFLQHIISVYQDAGIENIAIVKNADINFTESNMMPVRKKRDGENMTNNRVAFIDNYAAEKGRIYSLQLGLSALQGADYCFIQNIDNPFVTKALLAELHSTRTKADYVTPEYRGNGGHPILISHLVMDAIRNRSDYNCTLRQLLQPFSRQKVDADKNCLININRPQDYETLIVSSHKPTICD
jgi:CTP:molybdopterin cytidylyltransferase MocA